jgi:ankyrin repeat protein
MTLEETYQRTLREINGVDWEVTHRMFQFVAVASRPLRVEELAQLVAFDFEAGQTPIFDEGCRPKDPVYAVESKCSSFLAIVDGGHSFGKVVQFSHFSVKEFLTSTHLAGESDAIHRRYHVSLTPAHTLAARACLGILLHLDKNAVSSDSLKKWPLAEYAAEHWSHHARFKNVSRNVDDAVKRLFDPSKPHHLAVCVSIYDPESLLWGENRPAERPFPLLRTPLHYAALWGLDFIVDFLVTERPQDVQSRGPTDDATPLHLASKRGHVEVARLLIKHGADVMAQTKDGETPLHLAAQEGQVEVARMLTERRADVKALVKTQNKYGLTPLHLASVLGQEEVAGMLIERCADVMAESEYGFTPLHLASFRGQVGVACILIEHGAEAAAQDKDGETPLHLALQEGQVEVARMLIECGTDVEAKNKDGKTPLHLASIRGQLEVARMLIEREADVMAQNKDGETPLHLALQEGHVEVARILIGSGADVTAQNKYGLTPFHLATPGVHAEVTRIIFEHGANPVPKKPPMAKVASGNRILFIIGPLGTLLLVVAISFMFGLRRSNRHMV